MPLLDHAKFGKDDPWSGMHSTWAIELMGRLNKRILSKRYKARPNLHLGVKAEVDVATLERVEDGSLFGSANGHFGNGVDGGGIATVAPVYAPPAPVLTGEVGFSEPASFEVKVFHDLDGWQMVAAIELVSPANKDRDDSRISFASKCATYLAAGISVAVVDVVTDRQANLHLELCDLLNLSDDFRWDTPTHLSAVSYRTAQGRIKPDTPIGNGRVRLDVWPHVLAVGAAMPTVPLWLTPGLVVPLELEVTYLAACEALGIG